MGEGKSYDSVSLPFLKFAIVSQLASTNVSQLASTMSAMSRKISSYIWIIPTKYYRYYATLVDFHCIKYRNSHTNQVK